MSDPNKSNAPIIVGVIALLAILGGAGFYISKNMKKDEPAIAASSDVSPSSEAAATQAAPASGNKTAEPPATAEEEDETTKTAAAAGSYNGVDVRPGNPVVAKVDGQDITRVDVFRYIKMMPANVQQLPPTAVYPLALEQVVNTRLVQNKAENAGLENDPEVQQQLSMAKQQIVRSVFVQREVDKEIADSEVKKKYDDTIGKTPAVEEIKASHILVDSKDKAMDLIKQLDGGADFSKLAAEHSSDSSNKGQGGDLGWFAKNDMVPAFSEAAFKLKKGETSKEPVETQFGWHVIKVEDSRERPKPTLAEVEPMIKTELRREKLEAMLENWRKSAKIEKYDINGDPIKPQEDVAPAAGDASAPAPAGDTAAPAAAE